MSGALDDDVARSLFDRVGESPDDDAPRAVLADWWLERADPRGELIALQLKEAREGRTVANARRIAELLEAYETEWLGELARVTRQRVWRRGFLEEAELLPSSIVDEAVWTRVSVDRAVSTIKVLRKGRANESIYASFVTSPAMRALRYVEVSRRMLDVLSSRDAPLPIATIELTFAADSRSVQKIGHCCRQGLLPALKRIDAQIDSLSHIELFGRSLAVLTPHPCALDRLTAVSTNRAFDGLHDWFALRNQMAVEEIAFERRGLRWSEVFLARRSMERATESESESEIEIASTSPTDVITMLESCVAPRTGVRLRLPSTQASVADDANSLRRVAELLPTDADVDEPWREAIRSHTGKFIEGQSL